MELGTSPPACTEQAARGGVATCLDCRPPSGLSAAPPLPEAPSNTPWRASCFTGAAPSGTRSLSTRLSRYACQAPSAEPYFCWADTSRKEICPGLLLEGTVSKP